jgi:hypothetical protein
MEPLVLPKAPLESVAEELFNFAIDREDIKTLVAVLPRESEISRNKAEYELQLLRIISVGWGISFFLAREACRNPLGELYWKAVHEFAQNLSNSTSLMIGGTVDYFQVVRDRLDDYVNAMSVRKDAPEPVAVIGPEFAEACGKRDDPHATLMGSKLFLSVLGSVKEYFRQLGLLA